MPGAMLRTLHGSSAQPHEVGTSMVRHRELSLLPRSHSNPEKQVWIRPEPGDLSPGFILLIFLPPSRELAKQMLAGDPGGRMRKTEGSGAFKRTVDQTQDP